MKLGITTNFDEQALDNYFKARMKIYSVELKYHFDHNSARLGSAVLGDHYGKDMVEASGNPFSDAQVPIFIPIPDDEKKRFLKVVKYLCDKPHKELFDYDTTILMIQDGHYDTYLRLAYGLKDPNITEQERALVKYAIELLKKPQGEINENDHTAIFSLYNCRSQLIGLQGALFHRLSIPEKILTKHGYYPRTQGSPGWEKMTVEEHEHHQYQSSTIDINSPAMNRIFNERKRLKERETGEFSRILTCAIPCMKYLVDRYKKDPNEPLINQDISDITKKLKLIELKEACTLANLFENISNKEANIDEIEQVIERIENPSFMQTIYRSFAS